VKQEFIIRFTVNVEGNLTQEQAERVVLTSLDDFPSLCFPIFTDIKNAENMEGSISITDFKVASLRYCK